MKMAVSVEEFRQALERVISVVPSGDSVVEDVKIDTHGLGASISGSDTANYIVRNFNLERSSEQIGRIILPARRTLAFLTRVVGNTLTIEQDGDYVILRAAKFTAKLSVRSTPALFPIFETMPDAKCVLNLPSLKKLISRVAYAVPEKEGMFCPNLCLVEGTETRLRAMGSDNHRIAVADEPGNHGVFRLLLPESTLPLMKDMDGDAVQVSESDNNYFFKTLTELLLIRKTIKKFPSYQKAFDLIATATVSLTVQANILKDSLNLILPATVKDDSPFVVFTIEGEKLGLSTWGVNCTATDSVVVKVTNGVSEAHHVKINPTFVLDFLKHTSGEITMDLLGQHEMLRFSSGNDFQCFVMPLRGGLDSKPESKTPEGKPELTPAT